MRKSPRCTLEFALWTLEFARTAGKGRGAEDQDVLVDDQVPGSPWPRLDRFPWLPFVTVHRDCADRSGVPRRQNNGLIEERSRGQMIEVIAGRALSDARMSYQADLANWDDIINRVVDLVARFNTARAEVAATVHYAASALDARTGRTPTIGEVIAAVESWKIRRRPPMEREDILRAIVSLGTSGWLRVQPDASNAGAVDDLVVTGSISA